VDKRAAERVAGKLCQVCGWKTGDSRQCSWGIFAFSAGKKKDWFGCDPHAEGQTQTIFGLAGGLLEGGMRNKQADRFRNTGRAGVDDRNFAATGCPWGI